LSNKCRVIFFALIFILFPDFGQAKFKEVVLYIEEVNQIFICGFGFWLLKFSTVFEYEMFFFSPGSSACKWQVLGRSIIGFEIRFVFTLLEFKNALPGSSWLHSYSINLFDSNQCIFKVGISV
jgi:hypothetical protein